MQDDMKFNVKLTLKDIRNFCLAKEYKSIFSKIYLVFAGLFGFLGLITWGFLIVISVIQMKFDITIILWGLIGTLAGFIPISFSLVSFLIDYLINKNNFKKSRLMGKLQCYELMDEAIRVSSSSGSYSIDWNDIYKVEELKPCFLIFIRSKKILIIPRRCFHNEMQLNMFLYIMASKIDNKKLKLKNYKIGNISPDYDEVVNFNEMQQISESNIEPLAEVSFSLYKREVIDINLKIYYASRTGIIMAGIGVLLLLFYIRSLILYRNDSIVAPILVMVFNLGIPLLIYISTGKQFENDRALKKARSYKFYADYFIIEHFTGNARVRWEELVKIKEIKSAFLLFITPQVVHIIPKRVFQNKKDGFEALKNILKKYMKK